MLSDYLFAQPSYLSGFGGLFDFAGAMLEYNESPTPEIADWLALANDWLAVGDDYRAAVATFLAEHPDVVNAA